MTKTTTSLVLAALTIVAGGAAYLLSNNTPAYTPRAMGAGSPGLMGGAEYNNLVRANLETGRVEAADYLRAQQAVREYAASQAKSSNLQFIEMGPDNFAGRVRSVVLDPNNPNIIWTGGVTGGLWRSNDGANTWQRISSLDQSLVISSIAILGNGHIFVGTGSTFDSPNGSGGSGSIGNGLYRSVDNGQSWELVIGPSQPWSGGAGWSLIDKLEADRVDPNKLWVAANLTSGSGLRWHISGSDQFVAPTGVPNTVCRALEISSDGQVMLATFGSNQAYISNDFGATFGSIPQGSGEGLLPSANVGRLEFAISPDNPDFMFAMAATGSGSMNGVFASTNRGNTWSRVWPPNFGPNAVPELDLFGSNGQGFYDNVLAVRPGQPNTVWAGGVELWQVTTDGQPIQLAIPFDFPGCFTCVHADVHDITWTPDGQTVYVGTDGGIYKSLNGGQLFTSHNFGLNITQFYEMAFSPKGPVLGGTQDNGTIYIPLVGGNTELQGRAARGGDGFGTDISQIDPTIMFATLYFGDLQRTNDEGINFSYFYDSRLLAQQGQTQFGIGVSTDFFTDIRLYENPNDFNSQDSVTFVNITEEPITFGQTITFRGGVNSVEQHQVYTGPTLMPGDSVRVQDRITSLLALGLNGSNGIWVTRQALNFVDSVQWWRVVPNIGGTVSALEWSHDGHHLFIGTTDGRVVRVSGFNDAWTFDHADAGGSEYANTMSVATLLNINGVITGLGPDANDADRLLVTVGNYGGNSKVRLSTNATAPSPTFTNIWNVPSGFVGMPVYNGIIHAEDPDIMVIGTDFGVMSTFNGGQSWQFELDGIEHVPTYSIRQQTWNYQNQPFGHDYVVNPYVIYAGTHGRGIFRTETLMGLTPLSGLDPAPTALGNLTLFPNPVVDQAMLVFDMKQREDVMVTLYDMQGRIVREVARARLPEGEQRMQLRANDLQRGTYIVEVRTPAERRTARMVVTR